MTGVLELVEDVTGTLTSKRVDQLEQRRDERWLEGLWNQLRPLPFTDLSNAVPAKHSDASSVYIRPYLPLSPVQPLRAPQLTLGKYDFKDPTKIDAGKQDLARMLLYSNSVAIDDPIWWLTCDGIGNHYADGTVKLDARDRQKLLNSRPQVLEGLRFLAEYRPLIKTDRLVLVPFVFDIHYRSATKSYEITDTDADAVTDVPLPKSWPSGYDNADQRYLKKILFQEAMEAMEAESRSVHYFRKRLDFTTFLRIHQQALEKLLEKAPDLTDADRLQTLGKLPGLRVEADAKRLVELARSDDTFGTWRIQLGKALDRIARLNPHDLAYGDKARRAFQEELYDTMGDARRKRKKHGWRGAAIPRIEDIAIGSVGLAGVWAAAGVLGSTSGPAGAVALVSAGLARTVWTYAQGWGARRQAGAIEDLYDELWGNDADRAY